MFDALVTGIWQILTECFLYSLKGETPGHTALYRVNCNSAETVGTESIVIENNGYIDHCVSWKTHECC